MICPECKRELDGQDLPIGKIYPCRFCNIIVLKLSGGSGEAGVRIVMNKDGVIFTKAPPLDRSDRSPITGRNL